MGNFKSKIILLLSIVVISIFITACGSENDSNGVSKAVEGEKVEEIFCWLFQHQATAPMS